MIKELIVAVLFLTCITEVGAQDFVYRPINPAFGGDFLNYGWMLNSANSQNTLSDPNAEDPFDFQANQLERFTESLNSQLLSELSRQIFSSQFGSEGLQEGSFQFGDFQVEITPGINGLDISVFDFANGGQTQITIPTF